MKHTIVLTCEAPEKPHAEGCDRRAHTALILAVEDCVDPPIFRAMVGDHTLCPIDPCDDCR
jgi:hypothetical protein